MRTLLASAGLIAALTAAAYGATRQAPIAPDPVPRPGASRPPKPRITERPGKTELSTSARFGFTARGPKPRFECRLDAGRWRACRVPAEFTGLVPGEHVFFVRAVGRRGRRSRAARFGWRLLEPKSFSIVPKLSGLSALYPGATPLELPLLVANPNPAPIFVTSLRVAVSADPARCPSAENLAVGSSGASSSAPLTVPAEGSLALPAPGTPAPTIQLRDLSVNQDACKNARFSLEFSGSARG